LYHEIYDSKTRPVASCPTI